MSEPTAPQGFTLGGMAIEADHPDTSPPANPPPLPLPAGAASAPGAAPPPRTPFTDPSIRRVLRLDESLATVVPSWVRVPDGMKFPRGRKLRFIRYPSRWTDVPEYGHEMPDLPGLWRQVIMWGLSPGDEQLAAERALGNEQRFSIELVKQAVRVIDGYPVDQTGMQTPHNVDVFWAHLGAQGRSDLQRVWAAMQNSTQEQRLFFLGHCVAQGVVS